MFQPDFEPIQKATVTFQCAATAFLVNVSLNNTPPVDMDYEFLIINIWKMIFITLAKKWLTAS